MSWKFFLDYFAWSAILDYNMSVDAAEVSPFLTSPEGAILEFPPDHVLEEKIKAIAPDGQIEIRGFREGGLVECYVPFDFIDNEEVPVNEAWADSLARDFSHVSEAAGGTGQHTPILLGIIEGEPKLKIVDGFHRSAGLHRRGEERVFATVKETDWDSLYKDRIYNAKDNVHVRFSRVVQWVRESWQLSGLSDRMSVEQAVLLYASQGSGKKHKVAPEDADAVKAWVEQKEALWDIAAITIYDHLKVAEHVDPALVHSTRPKTSSHSLEAPTQQILKVFSKELPDKFGLQNLVMEAAKQHNLKAPHVRSLCRVVKDCPSFEAAEAALVNIDWENWQPEYAETKKRDLRGALDPRKKGALVLATATKEIEGVIERVDVSRQRGEGLDDEMRANVKGAQTRVVSLIERLGVLGVKLAELVEQAPVDTRTLEQELTETAEVLVASPEPPEAPVEPEPSTEAPEPSSVSIIVELAQRAAEPSPAKIERRGIQESLKNFGIVKFPIRDFIYPFRQERVLRIANVGEVNHTTEEIAKKHGVKVNDLVISQDGRPNINGSVGFGGHLEIEMLNILLASYLTRLFPLSELSSRFGFSDKATFSEQERRLNEAAKFATLLLNQGVVFYKPVGREKFGLRPVRITDKRA